mmetsp:Transcript_3109/g.8761  ORF Transcript_3109/g.8761 Transcript_3109/m.8761 type:complete len:507 (-) Transcript_3109:42-1562(-)
MFRRVTRSMTWGSSLSASETAAVEQLVATRSQPRDESPADGEAEGFPASTEEFLSQVEHLANALGLDPGDRGYRTRFSANYRALFPDGARRYRIDVLEASADQPAIWVNGDKFELSAEAMACAEALQQAWAGVSDVLDRWSGAATALARPTRQDFTTALNQLDAAWADFEERYVSELIVIEARARNVLMRAIEQESALSLMGMRRYSSDFRDAQHRLVGSISRLNAVANFRRKGRDDLKGDILDSAQEVLRRCDAGEEPDLALRAVRCLASDVVESFEAMRKYFREVSRCLERVDPHLCNNSGLVARLVDWEESWEVGAKYVRDSQLLAAVSTTVVQVKASQELSPTLEEMFVDCDAELFLVLPRLVWIYYIAEPSHPCAGLVRHLLPHRFKADSAQPQAGEELQKFVDHFAQVVQTLGNPRRALERLTKRAIAGSFEVADPTPKSDEAARKHRAVEGLMRELEGWSLELQRHCPEDWNQCIALIIQCLQAEDEKPKPRGDGAFQV